MKDNKVTPAENETTFMNVNDDITRVLVRDHSELAARNTISKWRDYINTQRILTSRKAKKLYEQTNDDLAEESLGQRGFQRSLSASEKGACFLIDEPVSDDDMVETPGMKPKRQASTASDKALLQYFIAVGRSRDKNKTIDLGFIDSLLKSGSDIACCDKYGQTVLHETARTWHVDVARFLIERGAQVNKVDDFGRTPMHVASALDYPEMLAYLLQCGGDIHQRTFGEEQTSVHYAAKHDAVDSLKFLLKFGADMTVLDYKGRTPLQLAAELDRSETCKVLVDQGATIGVQDSSGMSAIVLMINKMPPVAMKALDQFHKKDRANRKQLFYLNYLEPTSVGGHSHAQSALQVAVEANRFDLILHPVLRRLIEVKWDYFGRFGAWYLVMYNFICCVIWTALISTYPRSTRAVYLPLDKNWYRIILASLSMLIYISWLRAEAVEFRRSRRLYRNYVKWREAELNRDLRFCHPRWPEEHAYIEREINELHERGPRYFVDWWNYVDWLTYIMVMATIIAHVISVVQVTDQSFRVERAIGSVMLVFVWIRFMKYVRAFKVLGPFIVMLQHVAFDVLRIGFLLMLIYVPYAAAFWSVFGSQGVQGYDKFTDLCYNLLQIMVVGDFGFDDLQKHDGIMARLLCGTFIVIAGIICLNLFIALLSDTFQRVYDNAKANAEMQRASIIMSLGNEMPAKRLQRFRHYIHIRCAPEVLYYDDDTCEPQDLKLLTQQIKENIDGMKEIIQEDIESRSSDNSTSDPDHVNVTQEMVLIRNEMKRSIYLLNKEANDLKTMVSELVRAERQRQQKKQMKRKRKLALQLAQHNTNQIQEKSPHE